MLEKMNAFVDKWKNAKNEHGILLFKQATIHAISNLKVHIMAGCLSDIPTGGGTNCNERFHSHINSFFNKSRIGILLAYALLTVIIHSHNTVVTTKGRRVCRLIIESPFQREHTSLESYTMILCITLHAVFVLTHYPKMLSCERRVFF